MSRIFVKPKKGMLVRDPISKQMLPENGKAVTKSTYWLRRIKDGDVVLTTKGGVEKAPEKSKETKEGVKK